MSATDVIPDEARLDRDPRRVLAEGSRHFDETSAVFQALRRICERLRGLDIPFAVVGGMALSQHKLRRFTEDVALLVTKPDLKRIHDSLSGLGYLPPHGTSRDLRDTELGVRIEFLTTGEYVRAKFFELRDAGQASELPEPGDRDDELPS